MHYVLRLHNSFPHLSLRCYQFKEHKQVLKPVVFWFFFFFCPHTVTDQLTLIKGVFPHRWYVIWSKFVSHTSFVKQSLFSLQQSNNVKLLWPWPLQVDKSIAMNVTPLFLSVFCIWNFPHECANIYLLHLNYMTMGGCWFSIIDEGTHPSIKQPKLLLNCLCVCC